MEHLVGNTHPRSAYTVRLRADQCHSDDAPATRKRCRGSETSPIYGVGLAARLGITANFWVLQGGIG